MSPRPRSMEGGGDAPDGTTEAVIPAEDQAEQPPGREYAPNSFYSAHVVRGAVVAYCLGCWTRDSRVVDSIITLGMVCF